MAKNKILKLAFTCVFAFGIFSSFQSEAGTDLHYAYSCQDFAVPYNVQGSGGEPYDCQCTDPSTTTHTGFGPSGICNVTVYSPGHNGTGHSSGGGGGGGGGGFGGGGGGMGMQVICDCSQLSGVYASGDNTTTAADCGPGEIFVNGSGCIPAASCTNDTTQPSTTLTSDTRSGGWQTQTYKIGYFILGDIFSVGIASTSQVFSAQAGDTAATIASRIAAYYNGRSQYACPSGTANASASASGASVTITHASCHGIWVVSGSRTSPTCTATTPTPVPPASTPTSCPDSTTSGRFNWFGTTGCKPWSCSGIACLTALPDGSGNSCNSCACPAVGTANWNAMTSGQQAQCPSGAPSPGPTANPGTPTPTPSCLSWGGNGRACTGDAGCCPNYVCRTVGDQPLKLYSGCTSGPCLIGVNWVNNWGGDVDIVTSSALGSSSPRFTGPTQVCLDAAHVIGEPDPNFQTLFVPNSVKSFVEPSVITKDTDSTFLCNLQQNDKHRYKPGGVIQGCKCEANYTPMVMSQTDYNSLTYNIHIGNPTLDTLWGNVVFALDHHEELKRTLAQASNKVSDLIPEANAGPGGCSLNTSTCVASPTTCAGVCLTVYDATSGDCVSTKCAGGAGGATFSFTPNSYDFGALVAGAQTSSPKSITIKNTSTLPAGDCTVSVSDTANFVLSNTDGCLNLAAGISCSVMLVAKPTAQGLHNATLSISCDGLASNQKIGIDQLFAQLKKTVHANTDRVYDALVPDAGACSDPLMSPPGEDYGCQANLDCPADPSFTGTIGHCCCAVTWKDCGFTSQNTCVCTQYPNSAGCSGGSTGGPGSGSSGNFTVTGNAMSGCSITVPCTSLTCPSGKSLVILQYAGDMGAYGGTGLGMTSTVSGESTCAQANLAHPGYMNSLYATCGDSAPTAGNNFATCSDNADITYYTSTTGGMGGCGSNLLACTGGSTPTPTPACSPAPAATCTALGYSINYHCLSGGTGTTCTTGYANGTSWNPACISGSCVCSHQSTANSPSTLSLPNTGNTTSSNPGCTCTVNNPGDIWDSGQCTYTGSVSCVPNACGGTSVTPTPTSTPLPAITPTPTVNPVYTDQGTTWGGSAPILAAAIPQNYGSLVNTVTPGHVIGCAKDCPGGQPHVNGNPNDCNCSDPTTAFDVGTWSCIPCPIGSIITNGKCQCPYNWEPVYGSCRPKIPSGEYTRVNTNGYYPVCSTGTTNQNARMPISYGLSSSDASASGLPRYSNIVNISGKDYNYSGQQMNGATAYPGYFYADLPHCGCSGQLRSSTPGVPTGIPGPLHAGAFKGDTLDYISSFSSGGLPNKSYGMVAIASDGTSDGRSAVSFPAAANCGCPNVNEYPRLVGDDNSGVECVPVFNDSNRVFAVFDPVVDDATGKTQVYTRTTVTLGGVIPGGYSEPLPGNKVVKTISLPTSQSAPNALAAYNRHIWKCQIGYELDMTANPPSCKWTEAKHKCDATSPMDAGSNDIDTGKLFNKTINKKLACCMNNRNSFLTVSSSDVKFDCVDDNYQNTGDFEALWKSADDEADGGEINGLILSSSGMNMPGATGGKPVTGFYTLEGSRCSEYSEFDSAGIQPGIVNPTGANSANQQNLANGVTGEQFKAVGTRIMPALGSTGYTQLKAGFTGSGKSMVAPQPATGNAAENAKARRCPILVRAALVASCPPMPKGQNAVKYTNTDSRGHNHCPAAETVQVHIRAEQVFEIAGQPKMITVDTVVDRKSAGTVSLEQIIRKKNGVNCLPGMAPGAGGCHY